MLKTIPRPKYESGRTTTNDDPYHQRYINGVQILVQRNRHRVWHGYVGHLWKCSFTTEEQAVDWLTGYALASV